MPGPGHYVRSAVGQMMDGMRIAVDWMVNPIVNFLGSAL
jgi:hypothetical protein